MKIKLLCFAVALLFTVHSFGQAVSNVPDKLTPAEKVYGLSKFWQEVNYNFVYFDKVDREMWDNAYKEAITTVQNTKNDYEYYRELEKFCALLKDGHTNIYMPDDIEVFQTSFCDNRLYFRNIDGRAIVVWTSLSKKDDIPVGSEVVEVNGEEVKKYIEKYVAPYISSSTDYIREDLAVYRLLRGLKGDVFTVKFKLPDGEYVTRTLTLGTVKEKTVYPESPKRELLDFRWVGDSIAYLSPNSFDDEKINDLFLEKLPELYNAKKLIIDLRNNGGGSTDVGLDILKYLVNDDILHGSRCSSRMNVSAYKAWGIFLEAQDTLGGKMGFSRESTVRNYLAAQDKYYFQHSYSPDTLKVEGRRIVVPTVILTGHDTASAAEDFLIYADGQKHMTRIGELTFGSTGQPLVFDMPGGGSARVCAKKDTYHDGREFVGYGIKPDIEVKPTLSDYLNGRDPVLEKAIEYLGNMN